MTSESPSDGELEVSIFGPGYGEAIALHVGLGRWILVDSCLEPNSGKPAHLQYLKSLGLDASLAVKLVVVTHWHDDHVQGIGMLVRECKSAEIVVSAALKSPHFSALLDLYGGGAFPGSSGVTEFVNVFRILDERRKSGTRINAAKLAVPDKLLYRDNIYLNKKNHEVDIYSLSPSDSAILSAQLDFCQRIPDTGTRKKRIVCPSTNNTSVVLWVRIGDHRILLGSDLEKTNDPKTGWAVVINESQAIKQKASVYKVAHHGAESSHDPDIWSKLLSDKPFALLSPYLVAGNSLPRDEDLDRVAGLTSNGYITAPPKIKKFRPSDAVVRDMIQAVTKSMRSVNIGWGQVRLRRNIEGTGDYKVELFGDAYNIEPN
jgi:hypothetical protein